MYQKWHCVFMAVVHGEACLVACACHIRTCFIKCEVALENRKWENLSYGLPIRPLRC